MDSSTILAELIKERKPQIVFLALLGAVFFVGISFSSVSSAGQTTVGILGGPAADVGDGSSGAAAGALLGVPRVGVATDVALGGGSSSPQEPDRLTMGAVSATDAGFSSGRGGLITYVVERGDTLSEIAANFGISVQTVIASNPDVKGGSLRLGQELQIPSVSGLVYRTKDGETAEGIAEMFGIALVDLRLANREVQFSDLRDGTTLIIPGVSPLVAVRTPSLGGSLPDFPGYFAMPTDGFNWGQLHAHNAVDIANRCGTPVRASAEGLVIDTSFDEWGQGYGYYVIIEHPNGTKTRYAHLELVKAEIGDYLKQGVEIGTMGATGEATGCHLHFEVANAKNPFVRK